MKNITMFSWGYWGWGRAMREFDAATDAVEKSRGFKPPIFVDIRLRRAVRALNMQGDNLAKIVGANRYVWMNDLGNLSIATRDSNIRIKKPAAAADLLDRALAAARERRRIVFFCACKTPKDEWGVACHRHVVGSLLLKEAARRGIDLNLVEWPGGKSKTIGLHSTPKQLRSVKSVSRRFPIGKKFPDAARHVQAT